MGLVRNARLRLLTRLLASLRTLLLGNGWNDPAVPSARSRLVNAIERPGQTDVVRVLMLVSVGREEVVAKDELHAALWAGKIGLERGAGIAIPARGLIRQRPTLLERIVQLQSARPSA